MRPVTRARALDRDGDAFRPRGIAERDNIPLPGLLVEICREEPASLVRQHGIDAGGKFGRVSCRFTGQVGANDVVAEWNEGLIWTLTAFDLWFSADPPDPLVPTDRRVARLSAFRILPSAGKYLFSSAEQAPE
jgi:hypothetical protein